MNLLEHILLWEGVGPDTKKLETIKDWKRPVTVKGIWFFLGLVNFYRKFIKDFSQLAKPLLNLLKNELSFKWKEEEQKAFEDLKDKLSSTHVLKFLNFTKPLEVHTDAIRKGVHARWTLDCFWGQQILWGSTTMTNSWKKVVCYRVLLESMATLFRDA